MEQDQEK